MLLNRGSHRKTKSYGGGKGSKNEAWRQKQADLIKKGEYDEAFMMEADDVLSIDNSIENNQAIFEAIDAIP